MTPSNHFYSFKRRGAQESCWRPMKALPLPSPVHISSLPCSLSRWPSLIPTCLEPSRRSLTGQEPEEEETCKFWHGGQSSPDSLIVGKAARLPPPSTTGLLQEGPHPIWRLRTTSADTQSPPLPSTPDLSWVSHAMLSSKVGLGAACLTTGQGLWAS